MKQYMRIFMKFIFFMFIFSKISYGLNVGVINIPKNDTLNIREQPNLNANKVGEFAFNASLIDIYNCKKINNKEKVKEWCEIIYHIKLSTDEYDTTAKRGWIAKKYLSFAPYKLQQQKKYRNKTYKIIKHQPKEFLNVRIGRGTQYEIVDQLPYNQKNIKIKTCLKTKNGSKWCWIHYHIDKEVEEYREGWVSAKYLKEEIEAKKIPKQIAEKIDDYASNLVKKEIGKPFVQIGHVSNVVSVVFSPNDKYILSASEDGTLILWDANSLKEIHTFVADSKAVTSAIFSPDGNHILSGGEDKTLKLWDVKTGYLLKVFRGHTRGVNTVSFSPDGKKIISGSEDETLILWNVDSGKILKVYKGHEGSVLSVAFSPDGKQIVSGSWDETTILWNRDNVIPVKILKEDARYKAQVYDVAFSPDGTLVVSASGDSTIKVWDRSTGKKIKTFKGHKGAVRAIAFSPDGNCLLSGGEDKILKLWDIFTGEEIKSYTGHNEVVKSVAFSSDGKYILSGSLDNTVKLWDRKKGEILKSSKKNMNVSLNSKFIPNTNKILASYDDHTLKSWDLEQVQLMKEYIGHSSNVWSFEFLSEGDHVISGDEDGNIIHWNLSKNKKIKKFIQQDKHDENIGTTPIDSLRISEDSKYMITRGPTEFYFWDLQNDKLMFNVDNYTYHILSGMYPFFINDTLSSLKISNQEYEAFSKFIGAYDEYKNPLNMVAGFSKNGNIILYNKSDENFEFWDIKKRKLIKKVNCSQRISNHIKFSLHIDNKGALVVADANKNKELVKLYSFTNGEWIAITPEGYFNASANGAKYLNVLTGPMSVTTVDAYYETFFRPDIVKAALEGKTIDTGLAMSNIKPEYQHASPKSYYVKPEFFQIDYSNLPQVDLDGDGVIDHIQMKILDKYTGKFILQINDKFIKETFEAWDMEEFFAVIDINKYDRQKEVIVYSPGSSADDEYFIFSYHGKKIKKILSPLPAFYIGKSPTVSNSFPLYQTNNYKKVVEKVQKDSNVEIVLCDLSKIVSTGEYKTNNLSYLIQISSGQTGWAKWQDVDKNLDFSSYSD